MAGRYVGVDGCRGGWVVAVVEGGRACAPVLRETFAEVIECARGAALVLVDIPIGLPDAWQGQRRCDVAARQELRHRGCCVFPAPIRDVVELPIAELPVVSRQREACTWQRQLARRGLTIQACCLLPKIREVDRLMRADPALQEWVRESHPELCFAALNDGWPMRHRKRAPEGYEERVNVLRRHLPEVDGLLSGVRSTRRRGAYALDDVLDALALAVNAWLGSECGWREFPPEGPQYDPCGLQMEMVTARWEGLAPE